MKALQLVDQLQKTRALQSDIIHIRIRKFLLLAHQTLTGSGVDTKNLTPEERELFQKMVDALCAGRNRIIEGGQGSEMETTGADENTGPLPMVKCASPEGAASEQRERPPEKTPTAERTPPPPSGASLDSSSLVVMRILEDVPDFAMGDGGSTSLKKKDVVALPKNLAAVLEQHKKAKPVV